jgi:NAD(P)-dependent dehydrogenase (short-subunit alcohol dehydrogenase family)
VSPRIEGLFSVQGRTVVVTGASGFLGRTMCEALLENGSRVIALGRSERLDHESAGWIDRYGSGSVLARRVDMYDIEAFTSTLAELAAAERVDVVVNNAHEMGPGTGFNSAEGPLEHATVDSWMRNLTGGVLWAALTTQVLGAGMRERGAGSIVNVASMYGVVAPSPRLYEGSEFVNPPGYSAAKAGMLALTRYTASFWGPDGVRANAILPGPFSNTDGEGPNTVAADDPFLRRLSERTALGRTGRPAELVGALLFLASDASSYITGHSLVVDGGWTIT